MEKFDCQSTNSCRKVLKIVLKFKKKKLTQSSSSYSSSSKSSSTSSSAIGAHPVGLSRTTSQYV
ncbi:MAG: hypothetical protein QW666_03230, partial [Candidatus Woesearchaeota archaeon]